MTVCPVAGAKCVRSLRHILFTHHLCKPHSQRNPIHTCTFTVQRWQNRQAHTRVEGWNMTAESKNNPPETWVLQQGFADTHTDLLCVFGCVCFHLTVSTWTVTLHFACYSKYNADCMLVLCVCISATEKAKLCLMCDDSRLRGQPYAQNPHTL